jgi:GNAT superfamily N-acetyltransferase
MPDLSPVARLGDADEAEVLAFLDRRPVHTVVMSSFILDNGMDSEFNRGAYFGYRSPDGDLEAVALIGHATMLEARSERSLEALAYTARTSDTPIHVVLSNDRDVKAFWNYYSPDASPRLSCTELLFEVGFPFAVPTCDRVITKGTPEQVVELAEAHAAIALMESGVDPMAADAEGFLKRTMRRIEQGRVYAVYENGKLVFKADVVAETESIAYLEGIYVDPAYRGKGIGSECLAKVTLELLKRVPNVCLLSNINFIEAHLSFFKAGYKNTGSSTALFT